MSALSRALAEIVDPGCAEVLVCRGPGSMVRRHVDGTVQGVLHVRSRESGYRFRRPLGGMVVVPPLVVPIDVSVLQGRFGLTRIQAEVARSFAAGKSVAEIARARGRSENTVACHVREVDRKLAVRRRVELVSRLAWRRGSIPPLS